jgi:hypothetical protein
MMSNKSKIESKSPIVSRRWTGVQLGDSCVDTIIAIERAGKLTPIRLTDAPNSPVFYKRAEVEALIEGDADHHALARRAVDILTKLEHYGRLIPRLTKSTKMIPFEQLEALANGGDDE